MNICPYCNSAFEEICQSGFVGCSHCYEEIQPLKETLKRMYGEKKHKGKKVKKDNGDI